MHDRAWLLPILVAGAVVASIVSTRSSPEHAPGPPSAASSGGRDGAARTALSGLDHYVDPDFGFSLGVPSGWRAIVAAETDAQLAMLEPGYAVGFESPSEHEDDLYTDYLMIEILPGDESGGFASDGSRRRRTRVDGRPAWREELRVTAGPAEALEIELVVHQAELVGLGYTIGFYAVGEPARGTLLAEAFEVMLRTFRLPRTPFLTS